MSDDEPIPAFTVIPAQPGWSIAEFLPAEGSDPPVFVFEPVIAWKIKRRHAITGRPANERSDVVPITVEGDFDVDSAGWVYRRPDGTFTHPYSDSFDTEAAALKRLQERHERLSQQKPVIPTPTIPIAKS